MYTIIAWTFIKLIKFIYFNKYKYYLKLYSTTKDAKLKKEYSFKLYNIRKSFKLTEYDLQAFGVLLQRKYKKTLSSILHVGSWKGDLRIY